MIRVRISEHVVLTFHDELPSPVDIHFEKRRKNEKHSQPSFARLLHLAFAHLFLQR